MNNTRPIFVMMVGLPGSGKSTYAKELSNDLDAIICSSDTIRKELCGDINLQDKNEEVFKILHNRTKENLRKGKSIIYDATNINSKRRRAFLSELKNIPCYKKCVIMATPFSECCKRNDSIDRNVPYDVIKRMYMNWNTPYWFEGWDDISIKYKDDIRKVMGCWVNNHLSYEQDNPHHSITLGLHCRKVSEFLAQDKLLECAGFLHDCGKPFTKTFVNSKGETTNIAHYYQHHCVGAYDSLFYLYPSGVDKLDVSILINLHMFPYFWEKDKEHGEDTRSKYKRLWGEWLYGKVMELHKADKMSH